MLFKMLVPRHALHAILSIQDHARSAVGIEHGRRGSQLLEPTSGFLATRAIAGAGHNRLAHCLELHFAALAHRGEVFVLFLVHCVLLYCWRMIFSENRCMLFRIMRLAPGDQHLIRQMPLRGRIASRMRVEPAEYIVRENPMLVL